MAAKSLSMRVAGLLVLGALACTGNSAGDVGDACFTTFDCKDELACFETMARGNECMARCTADDRLCDDGSVCLQSPTEVYVCYLGGDVQEGQMCLAGGDCEPGTVCVRVDEDTRCRRACDTRAPTCGEGQTCVEIEAPNGYCGATAAM